MNKVDEAKEKDTIQIPGLTAEGTGPEHRSPGFESSFFLPSLTFK